MSPDWTSVFFDNAGADSFEKIALLCGAPCEPVFEIERFVDAATAAHPMDRFKSAGHRQRGVARYLFKRVPGRLIGTVLQLPDTIAQTLAIEIGVDHWAQRVQLTDRGCARDGIRCVGIASLNKGGGQRGPRVIGDVIIRKSGQNRIPRPHSCRRCCEIFAQSARRMGQQIGPADIRDQSNGGLRHRNLAAVADNPVRAVTPYADTAPHGKALQQGHNWLGEGEQRGIHAVLVGPKPTSILEIASDASVIHFDYITARAKGACTDAVDQNKLDLGIVRPIIQGIVDLDAHLPAQGVQNIGAVQRDPPSQSITSNNDVTHLGASSKVRAVISRMISFVPSKIWCTRRSRTIFSIP